MLFGSLSQFIMVCIIRKDSRIILCTNQITFCTDLVTICRNNNSKDYLMVKLLALDINKGVVT